MEHVIYLYTTEVRYILVNHIWIKNSNRGGGCRAVVIRSLENESSRSPRKKIKNLKIQGQFYQKTSRALIADSTNLLGEFSYRDPEPPPEIQNQLRRHFSNFCIPPEAFSKFLCSSGGIFPPFFSNYSEAIGSASNEWDPELEVLPNNFTGGNRRWRHYWQNLVQRRRPPKK